MARSENKWGKLFVIITEVIGKTFHDTREDTKKLFLWDAQIYFFSEYKKIMLHKTPKEKLVSG